MSKVDLKQLKNELATLSVFRNLLYKKELGSFFAFLECEGDMCSRLSKYGEFVNSLSASNASFSDFLKKSVCEDENIFITLTAAKKEIPSSVTQNTERELEIFTALSEISCEDIREYLDYDGYLPEFENEKTDFRQLYLERSSKVATLGYGVFASYPMFSVADGKIVPVESNDNICVEGFVGYEKERSAVIDNTLTLVEGGPAANVLLYGDAGTGKSSTVKAVANLFFDKGVRLIEIRKDQLLSLSDVMAKISKNPLKFIIFIDDLSFNKNDDQFSMLKAALEGSASAKAPNAVIYATSNRRHIVKETFSERASGDDIHRNDTVQELLSLSERFGLTVYFSKPNKILYLDIVHQLAERYGIDIDRNELEIKAEAFALNKGSRSPRAAEQFIKSLVK